MLAPLIAGTSPACVSSAVRCAAVDHDARLDSSPWLAQAHRLGGRHWVANADVQVDVVTIGQQSVPVTLLAGAPSSSTYVASLHAAWISYPFAEVVARATRWQRTQASAALLGAAPLTALLHSGGLHRAALVANHLLSTNLHTAWNASDIRDATAALVTRYPDRPLAMRNVCPAVDARLCEALTAAGWLLVPARRIYLVDPRDPAVWRHNHLKRDRKLLNGDDLELVGTKDIPAEELPSLRALFRELFLDKHCALNPDFTPAFFQLCHEHGFLDLYALRQQGRAVGVLGVLEHDGWVTTPLIGYDTTLPKELGVYRRLMALLYEDAKRRGCRLHLSSGAGSFKAGRGGEPHLEYTAIHTRHLGPIRRLAAETFARLLQRFAPGVLEHNG